MDQSTAFTEFWHILEDFDDYLREGYSQPHPEPPEFKVHLVRDNQNDELHPVKQEQIRETGGAVENCQACELHLARKQALLGEGNLKAPLMVVLPPPDYDADDAGRPIAGESREFLSKWIEAIGLNLDRDCYITNVVKCRPPGTRPAFSEELTSCRHFLQDQVDTIQPSMLLLLGPASLNLLDLNPRDFEQHRGKPLDGPAPLVISTYDPLFVMGHDQYKRPVWEDLKILKHFVEHGNRKS